MNNKIFKRVVAAAAGVAMLGTCAFATVLTEVTYDAGKLNFTYTLSKDASGNDQSKLTYLAYAATEAKDGDTNVKTIGDVTYALGNIVAVNQLDRDLDGDEEALISAELLGNAPYIVLLSGDDLGSTVAEAAVPVVTVPDAPAYEYNVALQSASYNGMDSTVVRITGLDPAAVTVTVDETVAKYYVNPATNANVIVACIEGAYTDVDAVKALVSIDEGTTAEMLYGDANNNGVVDSSDIVTFKENAGQLTVSTGRGKFATRSIPAGATTAETLMIHHSYDINGDGVANSSDIIPHKECAGQLTVSTGRGKFATRGYADMAVLKK